MDKSSPGTLDHSIRAIKSITTPLEVDFFVAIKGAGAHLRLHF